MPNWCENRVTAPKYLLDKLYDKKKDKYTMDTILPVPPILTEVTSGTITRWNNDSKTELSEEDIAFLQEQYGSSDWYDWQCTNRGTKWDFNSAFRVSDDTLEFDTAWSPPIEFFEHLSGLYPAEVIELEAHEGGCGLHAFYTIKNGGVDDVEDILMEDDEDDDDDGPPEQDTKEEGGDDSVKPSSSSR